MKLSVAYAVYNEQDTIIRSLKSVYDWVDEIVIVDGTSTDDTIKRIKKLDRQKKGRKIRTFERENPPMFHKNKQIAIDKCKSEWILQLDADEVVSKDLKEEILATIHGGGTTGGTTKSTRAHNNAQTGHTATQQHDGYWIPRLNYFLGKPLRKGGQYPDKTLRLYKNGKGRLPQKDVHEQAEVDGSVGTLHNDLLHFPYPTFKEFLHKWARYSSLEASRNKTFKPSAPAFFSYFVIKPKIWFLKAYFRHKGFVDGFPGFVFALFSSLRFWVEYIEMYERYVHNTKTRSTS